MKTLFIICLFAIGTQQVYAQQDTLNLNFRDKEVQVLSDEKGNGSKVITLDDGVRKTRVSVDFNAEQTELILNEASPINYFVKPKPSFTAKNKKQIYYTLNMRFGLIKLAGLYPESNRNLFLYDTVEIYQRSTVKNKVLESKYHSINWGLNIPTKFKRLSINTGLGISSQKIFFDNLIFRFSSLSTGYRYIGETLDSSQASEYGNGNIHIHTNSISIPLSIKYDLRKKGRHLTLGVNSRFQFRSVQDLSKDVQYSYLGIVYKNNPFFNTRSTYRSSVSKNFNRFNLDATITYGRGLFSVFAMTNVTPMFKTEFYRNEYENDRPYKRTFLPFSIRYGIQLNIW